MTVFVLKLIAMISMVIDHTAFWLVDNNLVMRNIGRLAFVIYAFLIAESYYHLKDKPGRLRRHAFKLLILCLVSEIPFDLFDHVKLVDFESQSVMPTLMFGFLALVASGWWQEKKAGNRPIAVVGSVIIVLAMAMVSYWSRSDYCFSGVVLIFLFYIYLRHVSNLSLPRRIIFLYLIEAFFIITDIWRRTQFGTWQEFVDMGLILSQWTAGAVVMFLPLAFYNRKLGYNSKWFSWLYSFFYPLQFVVVLIARYFMRGF